jgi:hypothetical protein
MSDYGEYRDRDGDTDGFERRRTTRDAWRRERRHYRIARARAEQRASLAVDLVKYLVVTLLLLLLIRPIGVIVAIVWGLRLLNRYSRSRLYPDLRRRWVDEEMRRREPSYDPAYRAALEEVDAV